jgi:hypothetical protein
VRWAGILLILVLLAYGAFIWLSPSRDFSCDVSKVIERHRDPSKALQGHQDKKDWCG